jgi:hypothetical protein
MKGMTDKEHQKMVKPKSKELTPKQKANLPLALQKAILAKKK